MSSTLTNDGRPADGAPELAVLVDAAIVGAAVPPSWQPWLEDGGAFARAWELAQGPAMMGAAALVHDDLRPVVRVAIGCARLASPYEVVDCTPQFPIAEAFGAVQRWIERPADADVELLARYDREVASWVRWVAGSSAAHAIADMVQLVHAIAAGRPRAVPQLARDVVRSACEAVVEDVLRVEGAPDGDSGVEERLRARVMALFTQLVHELVPRPVTTAAALCLRAEALRLG